MTGAVDLSGLKQRAQQGSTAAAPGGVEVTEANFEAEVLVRSGEVPVVVVLWSPRSDACVQLVDTLAGLAAADGGTLLSATAGKLGGNGSTEPAEDPALDAARDKLDAGEFAAAAAAYQAILDTDPNHAEAKGAMRQISFLERAGIVTPDVIAAADAAPDDIDAAFAAADAQILGQDVAGAFTRLTGLVKRTAGDDRTRVRTRLIELFELFDPADPEVIAGRRNLANALY